jgi:hypothetical protein
MAKSIISVGAGIASCLHKDQLIPILKETGGQVEMTRASRIEPDPEYQEKHGLPYTPWYVDLSPSGGEAYIPGFLTREAALTYEEDWINKNVFLTGEAIPLTIPTPNPA